MDFGWSARYIFLLVLCISRNDLVVHANSIVPSLQQPKSVCHDQEKLALLGFKRSFHLDCHAASSYPKVKSWDVSTSDCCRWAGVKCDKFTGHVTGLDLSNSCLYGTFPSNSSLFSLDHLLRLNLARNNFNYSKIPSDIGRLYKLTHLNLSESVFSGQIPSEISKLSSLSLLDLSDNGNPYRVDRFSLKLHDPSLEKLVYNLTRLTRLYLGHTDISSTVPLVLSNLTCLTYLSLKRCNLFGEFPTSIFQLPNLEVIYLDLNSELGGHLPEFHSSSPLRCLKLRGIKFSGELPTSLGNLGSLRSLGLGNCYFSGKIPSSIGNLTNLVDLQIDSNFFSGDLPYSITNLTRLNTLQLSNIMTVKHGVLNSWLPQLNTSLVSLGLIQMNFGNEILPALSNITRLVFLDLSHNHLTGPLPHWFMNLTQLHFLSLSSNQLHGPVSPWISHFSNLIHLSLSFEGGSSVVNFDSFLRLPYLVDLGLSNVSLTFPPNFTTNSSNLVKFERLGLNSCTLTEFPEFLRYQDELQSLSLNGNRIKGDIPIWFVNATRESLEYLDLSNNLLIGFEEPPVFLPWNKLIYVNFDGNMLQGSLPIPPSTVRVFIVSSNQFYGVIPQHFCSATSLVYIDLSENNLSGKIPSCIGLELGGSLQVLNLRGNKFGGTINQTFFKTCKLNMINLSQNQLEGKLPKSLVNCTMLEVLDVGSNRVNDTFPSWLGSLPKLQVLVLRHNNFHGKITAPLSDSDFNSLRIIDLSNNFHTGDLPSRYVQCWLAMAVSTENLPDSSNSLLRITLTFSDSKYETRSVPYNHVITITNKGSETTYAKILNVFRVIDFSGNRFSGSIPGIIGHLRGLQALNLSNNNLVGGIPSSLANITDLESLDLSENMLSGVIPQELTELTFLEIFNVSNNHLVGPIPQGKQFNTFDNTSFGRNLALCGAPLTQKCEKDSEPSSQPHQSTNDEKNEEDTDLIDWIVRSLGCVSGFITGYIIGKTYVADRHHDWFMETFGRKGRSKKRAKRTTQRPRRN